MNSTTKLYKYYLRGVEKPLVMECSSRKEADQMLIAFNDKTGNQITHNDVVDLRIETLVIGSSSKIKKGKRLIWVGKNQSKTGWITLEEYYKLAKKSKKQ